MIKKWLPILVAVMLAGCERQPEVPVREPVENGDQEPSAPVYTPATKEAEEQLQVQTAEATVSEAVQGFRVFKGRYPESLDELTEEGPLNDLPDLPEGYRYTYDASSGEVEVVEANE